MFSSPILLGLVGLTYAATTLHHGTSTASCSNTTLARPEVPGARVTAFSAEALYNQTWDNPDGPAGNATVDVCQVTVTVTHPGSCDAVTVVVWLPLAGWNGRFQAVGGGGWIAGYPSNYGLFPQALEGYATASTDGGDLATDASTLRAKVLPEPGKPNLALLADFSTRALHELAIIGKAITADFYGKEFKSYFVGCSNGGRQGYQLAQKYPTDFDGIIGAAPALYWPSLFFSLNWAHFLMNSVAYYPSPCEYIGFLNAAIRACDSLDGITDGIISNVPACNFVPDSVVGTMVTCEDDSTTPLTSKGAEIVRRIREGPRTPSGMQLWTGYDWGIDYYYGGLALTQTVGNATVDWPSGLAHSWFQDFIVKDTNASWSSVTTLEQFIEYWAVSYPQYGGIIAAGDPDLAEFRDSGGKLLTWHGLADSLIPHNQTLLYRNQVERIMGGYDRVNSFYRIFLAPGVGHCVPGYGPTPNDPLGVLIDWVEKGQAPETITASYTNSAGATVTRPLCLWPYVAVYDGSGDPDAQESFSCQSSY